MRRLVALAVLALSAACGGDKEASRPSLASATAIDLAEERWDGGFWELRARCPGGRIRFEFRPEGAVALDREGAMLASASLKTIDLQCGVTRRHAVELDAPERYGDAGLRGPVEARTTLVCSLPAEVEIAAHPIWYRTNYVMGSALTLATADLRLAAAASMKHDRHGGKTYSQLFYLPELCRLA
ncbi:MAG: hypothetical protein ICV64_07505 [Thermoleophilia bacterium]|nr:hypothetical protein [Thermoleophilia bacterium]